MNIFVGNLNFRSSEEDLRQLFAEFGTISSAKIIMDRDTGRSRGFGFVEMASDDEAKTAIQELNGKTFMEKTIEVNEARPKPSGGGGGGSRGGYGGGGGRDFSERRDFKKRY